MVDLELEALSTTEKLFHDEVRFIGRGDLVEEDIDIRRQIVSLIDRLSKSRRDLDAFEPYLAMTYFDRFWMKEKRITVIGGSFFYSAKVYAMSFMSLACKMRKSKFRVDDFIVVDGTPYWNIDGQDFIDTEIHILNVLEWRMKPLTAFSFIEYFSPFFRLKDYKNLFVDKGIRRREVSRIIVKFKGDYRFEMYKPSIIAASAFFIVAGSIMPKERLDEIGMEISRVRRSPESYLDELMKCQREMKVYLNLEDLLPLIPQDSNVAENSSGAFDILEDEEQMSPRTLKKGKYILKGEDVKWPIAATYDDDLLMEFRIEWPKVINAVQVEEEEVATPTRRSAPEAVMDCFINCCTVFCRPWSQSEGSSSS